MSNLTNNTSKILSISDSTCCYNNSKQSMICLNKIFFQMVGSLKAALFLTQAVYWHNIQMKKYGEGKFYKTDDDWSEETCLSIREIKSIRKKLILMDYISVRREKKLGINHYIVNIPKILADQSKLGIRSQDIILPKIGQNVPEDRTKCAVEIGQNVPSHIIHKTTHKTTPSPIPSQIVKEHRGEGRGLNQIEERELEQQTQEIMKIWESVPKPAGFDKVKSSLKIALTKKSFKAICEYGKDYITSAIHSKQDLNYVSRAHTWLDKEMWPKSKILSNYVPNPKSYQGYVPTPSKPKTKEELLLGDNYFKSIKAILKENKGYTAKKELKVA